MFTLNLTEKANRGQLDRVIGRERELERTIQILCRRQKNNPCLIGEPGVGKTAVAEALAQKIAAGDVPLKLKGCEVCLLDMTAMVAGTQFRGQFENRMKGLIEEVKKLGNIILVIDEVHNIVAAGDAEGGMNAANILKPALSRGEIHVIGATTLSEYRKYIEKDSALERRFQPVVIAEPSVEDTVKILDGIKSYYADFHGIVIPDETVRKAVILSERYITDRFLPDKAIDLLDEASAYLALHNSTVTAAETAKAELGKASADIAKLEAKVPSDDSTPEAEEYYRSLADAKTRHAKYLEEYEKYNNERKNVILTPEHLAEVIEIWTGIPAGTINENEFVRIDKLADRLKKRIVGQDKAVDAVAKASMPYMSSAQSRVTFFCESASASSFIIILAISTKFSLVRGLNVIISSILLINSGRRKELNAFCVFSSFTWAVDLENPAAADVPVDPALVVITRITFLKLTSLP